MSATTIRDLLRLGDADAPAIGAPEREALTFAGLEALAEETGQTLNSFGIGRNDRIAIVLPNGPEMAAAFVTIACYATTAPLNPSYREDEFAFYMEDLSAKALVVMEGDDTPAVAAAEKLGVPLLRLSVPSGAKAGEFDLLSEDFVGGQAASPGTAAEQDVALVLHTSGTTSRPKIVPLTHGNVCASAHNIATTLSLSPADKCLNIMPLFHIHGLMAATLSSLAAGGSVWCTPGFNALRFFAWTDEIQPTWYTAVPTMHQAILARAPRNKEAVERLKLRLIRSSSSSLPPQVMAALEETFGAPVIESYGMTEAAHQMASNLLPPGERKPATVGVAAGPEVEIMDEDGNILARGETGEIVIKGPNVTKGYENNPDANATAFTNGWFRTGDQGVMDAGGYISITGRLKEIINRGGEKISQPEVDNVLMDHPAIAQVVTFAMPHKSLGEEVAAAAVLREGMEASEQEIRDFAATRLADFKVPRKVLILEEIPKGATGKLQRIGLAEKLGLGS